MKSGASKVWLQKKPNIMQPQDETKVISSASKRMSNKGGSRAAKCPNCP